jgi:hypothetical protein
MDSQMMMMMILSIPEYSYIVVYYELVLPETDREINNDLAQMAL